MPSKSSCKSPKNKPRPAETALKLIYAWEKLDSEQDDEYQLFTLFLEMNCSLDDFMAMYPAAADTINELQFRHNWLARYEAKQSFDYAQFNSQINAIAAAARNTALDNSQRLAELFTLGAMRTQELLELGGNQPMPSTPTETKLAVIMNSALIGSVRDLAQTGEQIIKLQTAAGQLAQLAANLRKLQS